jgi:hypothetical protein
MVRLDHPDEPLIQRSLAHEHGRLLSPAGWIGMQASTRVA